MLYIHSTLLLEIHNAMNTKGKRFQVGQSPSFSCWLLEPLSPCPTKPRTLCEGYQNLLCLHTATQSNSTVTAYGSSQARGRMGATAASIYHSHGNARSKPRLWPTPQLKATLDLYKPLGKARERTRILMDPSWISYPWATMGTPVISIHDVSGRKSSVTGLVSFLNFSID